MTNDLIPLPDSRRLNEAERLRAIKAISAMLASFAQRPSGQGGFIEAFVQNIADLRIEVIEDLAQRFAKGRVPDRNNAFPPSAAEFYERATIEAQGDLIAKRARERIEATQAMITRYDLPGRTEEQRQRADALARKFRDGIAKEKIAEREEDRRKFSEQLQADLNRRAEENGGNIASDQLVETMRQQDEIRRLNEELNGSSPQPNEAA